MDQCKKHVYTRFPAHVTSLSPSSGLSALPSR
jgi:hypothetical protein